MCQRQRFAHPVRITGAVDHADLFTIQQQGFSASTISEWSMSRVTLEIFSHPFAAITASLPRKSALVLLTVKPRPTSQGVCASVMS